MKKREIKISNNHDPHSLFASHPAHLLLLAALVLIAAPAALSAGGLDLPPEPAVEPAPEPMAEAEEEPEEGVLGAEEPAPLEPMEPVEDEYLYGAAPIDRVRVLVTDAARESDRIIILAEGFLPDGCTELYEVDVELEGTTFLVKMTTRRPRERTCIEVAIPFRERIPLEIMDLSEGEYLVRVNEGAMGTFTVGVDREILGAEAE